MGKYVYTVHAEEKLKSQEARKLRITKKRIQRIVEKPIAIDASEKTVMIAIGKLSRTLSLAVVYKKVGDAIRIITFYPAEKGRYERKIL